MDFQEIILQVGTIRALIVDDEPTIRNVLESALNTWGIETESCETAEDGLQRIQQGDFKLLISDIHMDGRDGTWLLSETVKLDDPPMVFMITGMGTMKMAVHTLTNGAFDFLTKPIDLKLLKQKIKSALEMMDMMNQRKKYLQKIEEIAISERWRAQQLFLSGIDALIRALEAKDEYTEGHSTRVAIITEGIASSMNLPPRDITEFVSAARCHDIGKIGVPDAILLKEDKLTKEEFEQIQNHPNESARILTPIFKEMPGVIDAVKHHHERYDGSGYPDGLKGTQIPLGARIIAIADAYDAMTSNRVYRKARSSKDAIEEIISNSGKQFCPTVVKGFLNFYDAVPNLSFSDTIWENRRKDTRYQLRRNLIVRFTNREPIKATTIDLSAGGMHVELLGHVNPGEQAVVRLDGHPPQRAEVRWYREIQDISGSTYGELGLELLKPDSDYLNFVEAVSRMKTEKRENKRLDKIIPVNVITKNEVFKKNITNISGEGIFIQSKTPFQVGSEVRIIFNLPDKNSSEIEAVAQVVHRTTLQQAINRKGGIPGMGLQFSHITGDGKQKLISFMENEKNSLGHDSEDSGLLIH